MEKQTWYTKMFADNLSDLIQEDGGKIKELAAKIGLSAGVLSIYQNDSAQPSLSALCAIADYFKVPIDWLVGRSTVKDPKAAGGEVCEYLGLTPENVAFILQLTANDPESMEIANWIFAQKEFRWVVMSIWMQIATVMDGAKAGQKGDWKERAKHLYVELDNPRYTAMSALVHLMEDRAGEFLAEKDKGGPFDKGDSDNG